ncbi:MAG: S-methyl-5-thioribose-1-phosphate isomerase [Euzebyales bacterium]|nr:S-methyl-5-thioribose-1-phosphate isomerase [Euzebyales bacterium]
MGAGTEVFAVRWLAPEQGGPAVRLLDQTLLPEQVRVVDCRRVAQLAEAIRSMRVRGAPALGVAGAYGVVLGALTGAGAETAAATLTAQRPTAVNLGWGCRQVLATGPDPEAMLAAARRLDADNDAACLAIGRNGAALLDPGARILTHCNTGVLACQGIGTAFGIVRTAFEQGRLGHLWVDETRPLLQGSRLTAFEAAALGIPHAVVVDGAAGALLGGGQVDAVVVGADRIAANGDTANKLGTRALAVIAGASRVPFYVAAPTSTVDLATPDGGAIRIEERDPEEVRSALGKALLAPADSPVYNPAFDVTPATLVTAVVTEHGVAHPPYRSSLRAVAAP